MEKEYLTVDALTKYLKFKIESDENLKHVYVKGEISNFKSHSSGHFYFSLKDEKSKINAIMFKTQNQKLKFKPTEGMNVLVVGRISIYEQMGSYQIYVEEMAEDGIGNLYLAYEELKNKLEKEGLFNQEHKKTLPLFPERIGVVTAPTGAAVRDIITTLKRRFPISDVFLFPALVQGSNAYLDIINKLKQADDYDLDVIIVGRGGGSIEDLWAFNEEELVRTIFKLKTPVVAAIGHEIDFTIADFVADLRAPTPTAAAEIVVPNILDVKKSINTNKNRANEAIKQKINYQKVVLNGIKNNYVLKSPLMMYQTQKQHLDNLIEKINQKLKININETNNYLANIINKLELLNPLAILERGYSVTYHQEKNIKSIKSLQKNDIIITRLKDGKITSKVIELEGKDEK